MEHTDLLGIKRPIIQAPMAGVQDSALALAVASAGGLGSLPCAMLSPEQLEAELDRLEGATEASINFNFFCHRNPEPSETMQRRWRQLLSPYFAELDPANVPQGPARAPFSHDMADVLAPYAPRIVSFHFGLPESALLERVKAWGGTVLSSATTLKEALWLEAHGADGIIVQGLEAGGHRGMFLDGDLATQRPLALLLPEICAKVKVPVIAAGGIASARDVRRCLAQGAIAAQVGTSYLLCHEARTSPLHRAALAGQAPTALTNLFSGRPARGIVNRLIRELGPVHPDVPPFPLASAALNGLRHAAEAAGRDDFSPLWSGQNRTGCRSISAAELTRSLWP